MFPEIWNEIVAAKPERLENNRFERLVVLTETVHVFLLDRELRTHIPGESERRTSISQVVDIAAGPAKKTLRQRRADIAQGIAGRLSHLKPRGESVTPTPAKPDREAGNSDLREEDLKEWQGLLLALNLLTERHAEYLSQNVTLKAFGPEPRVRIPARPTTGKEATPANPLGKADDKPSLPAAPGPKAIWSDYEKFLREAFTFPARDRNDRKGVLKLDDDCRRSENIVWNETILAALLTRSATALDELSIKAEGDGWATVEQMQEAKRHARQRVATMIKEESPNVATAWWQRVFPPAKNSSLDNLGDDASRKFDELLGVFAASCTKDAIYKARDEDASALCDRIKAIDPYFSVGLWRGLETKPATVESIEQHRPGQATQAVVLQTQRGLAKLDEKLQFYAWWTKREGTRINALEPRWGDYGTEEAWRNAERKKYAEFSLKLAQLCAGKWIVISDAMAAARRKLLDVRRAGFIYDHDNYVLGVAVDALEKSKVFGKFPVGPYCSVRLVYRPPADFPAEVSYDPNRNSPNRISALLAEVKETGLFDDASFANASEALMESLALWHDVAPVIGLAPTRHPKGIECLYYFRPSTGSALDTEEIPKAKENIFADRLNSLVAGKKLIALGRSVLKFAALGSIIWAGSNKPDEVTKFFANAIPFLIPIAGVGGLIYVYFLAKWLFKNDVLVPKLRTQLDLIDLKLEAHFAKSMKAIENSSEALVDAAVDFAARSLVDRFEIKRKALQNALQGSDERVHLYIRQVERARGSIEGWKGELADIEWTPARKLPELSS